MRGFSLIEVLVALALFTLMTLALSKMQIIALQTTRDAMELSIAKQLVSNLAEVVCHIPLTIDLGSLYREWQQTITHQLGHAQGQINRQRRTTNIILNWYNSQKQQLQISFSCPAVTKV